MSAAWLERRDCDRDGLGSKPAGAICCVLERHFTALSPAWRSWQAVLNLDHIFIKLKNQNKNFNRTAISKHVRKQVEVISRLMYVLAPPSGAPCESGG